MWNWKWAHIYKGCRTLLQASCWLGLLRINFKRTRGKDSLGNGGCCLPGCFLHLTLSLVLRQLSVVVGEWLTDWMAQLMIVTLVKSFDWLSLGLSFSSVKCGCWSRSWRSLQLWNVMLVQSVTVQSLQHLYFLPANVGNVVEQRSVQLWSWKKRWF